MDIWQHKLTKKYYIQIPDTGPELTLITPIEGLKTFNSVDFERIITDDIKSMYEKDLLTDSQLEQCKKYFSESLFEKDKPQERRKSVNIEQKDDLTEVTVEEFVEILSYWVTQFQLKPSNVEFIAENIKFKIPRLFKKQLWDFHNELIALSVAIVHVCTIHYLGNKGKSEPIINEVIGLISKIAFPSSTSGNLKSLKKMIGWSTQINERRKCYVKKCVEMDSNSFPSMGRLFFQYFKHSKDPFIASVFLTTYIQKSYLELTHALQSYKIIGI